MQFESEIFSIEVLVDSVDWIFVLDGLSGGGLRRSDVAKRFIGVVVLELSEKKI